MSEAQDHSAEITNRPGLRELSWRIAPHAESLGRMRDWLDADGQPLPIRSLARQGTDEASVALLDAWAVVADVVSFYTERIAQEGFLRSATERESVRLHARTLGYELRPGVAAEAELAFEIHTGADAPDSVLIPAGTPFQTIPEPGQVPQTFETLLEIEARGVWNNIPAANRTRQPFEFGAEVVWLNTTSSGVAIDDRILIVGKERRSVKISDPHGDDHEKWDFRRVVAVTSNPDGAPGWTQLAIDRPLGYKRTRELVAVEDIRVYRLTQRANLFGWNAPDRRLLERDAGPDIDTIYAGYDLPIGTRELEIDGEQPALVKDSWLVLEQSGRTEAFQVTSVRPDGATQFALSGKVTRVKVDIAEHLGDFDRGRALVYAVSEELPAADMPLSAPIGGGHQLNLIGTDPVLPDGRLVLVTGVDAETGLSAVEARTVVSCVASADGATMTCTLEPALVGTYPAGSVTVRGNAALSTHGETVNHVLGSGDGRDAFPRFPLRRAPLTYVRTTTNATGAAAALEVRVEGVAWAEVPHLDGVSQSDQVYVVRQGAEGQTSVTFGDGGHGSRLPTGGENVETTYRVGIGAPGAAAADQIRLPVRKPRGLIGVTNPAPSRDWAPEESLEEARVNAPQRVRTLDRAVSVSDYQDFARGYAGVGAGRADLVWDGHRDTVVVSVLDAIGAPASESLLLNLQTTLDSAREARTPRRVIAGQVIAVQVNCSIAVDPTYELVVVGDAVRAALLAAFGSMDFATPLPASGVLVIVAAVPGVVSVTMPVLSAPALPDASDDLLIALPARWAGTETDPVILPAQALQLHTEGLILEVTR